VHLGVLFAAAVLSGCTGGQSGTETPSPEPEDLADAGSITTLAAGPCACALAPRSALLRAELLELETCRVRAQVQEVLGVSDALELMLEPGTELEARRADASGCGNGLALAPGDPILLVYSPADQEPGSENSALVATWGREHVFGMNDDQPIALPERERDRLLESGACASWFDAHGGSPADLPSAPVCD
jgi:hypothetical protein